MLTAQNLADWIKSNQTHELEKLPGLVGAKDALTFKTNKEQALQQMNRLDLQTMPVVDEDRKFVGVVDRSKLTASNPS